MINSDQFLESLQVKWPYVHHCEDRQFHHCVTLIQDRSDINPDRATFRVVFDQNLPGRDLTPEKRTWIDQFGVVSGCMKILIDWERSMSGPVEFDRFVKAMGFDRVPA